MDPENQEVRAEVDNDPGYQGDNPGFSGSDESIARSSERYAKIEGESGTSTPMEQETEREFGNNPRKRLTRRRLQGQKNDVLTSNITPHNDCARGRSLGDFDQSRAHASSSSCVHQRLDQQCLQGSSEGSLSSNEWRQVEYITYATDSCDVQTTVHTSANNGSGTSTHLEQETEHKPGNNTRKLSCENELQKRTSQDSSDGSQSTITEGEVEQTIYGPGSCDVQTTDL